MVCEFNPHRQTWYQKFVGTYPPLADQRTVHLPDLTLHGWNEDFRIRWFNDAFPQNVTDNLMDPNFDMTDDDIYGADQESDKEE